MGSGIISSVVPGFSAVLSALKAIHDLANQNKGNIEGLPRLMAYCGATTAALSQYARVIRLEPDALRALDDAATALYNLRDIIDEYTARSALEKLFVGKEYKVAAMSAKEQVGQAMHSVMELATVQTMDDAAIIKKKVDTLLERRSFTPHPTFLSP